MDVASTLAIYVGLKLDLLVQGTCKTTRALPSPTLIWYINGAPVTNGKAQKKDRNSWKVRFLSLCKGSIQPRPQLQMDFELGG